MQTQQAAKDLILWDTECMLEQRINTQTLSLPNIP